MDNLFLKKIEINTSIYLSINLMPLIEFFFTHIIINILSKSIIKMPSKY